MLRPARAALVAAALAVTARAAAQNADGVLLGTEAALTGGAVLATAHDAAGAYYNPAGLASLAASTLCRSPAPRTSSRATGCGASSARRSPGPASSRR